MDFIYGLPKVQGKKNTIMVVDRLTKYGHFIALSHPYTAATIAQLFLDHIFTLHGNLITIVSDRDPLFMSNFRNIFMKLQGVKMNFSSEVLNRWSDRGSKQLFGVLSAMYGVRHTFVMVEMVTIDPVVV